MIDFASALNTVPAIQWQPRYDGTGEMAGIRALTYEGMSIDGKPTRVFAYYARPAGTEPVPGMVLVHGGGGHAFSQWVRRWVDRGFAAIAMDTTGFFPLCVNAGSQEGQQELWTRTPTDGLLPEGYAQAPNNSGMQDSHKPLDQQWMYHALCDCILAHNILRAMPDVDSDHIGVTGISWGGVISSLLIGFDSRFAFAVPVYGSGYLAESMSFMGELFAPESVRALWLAEQRFDRVKMPVMWQCWNDDVCFSLNSNSRSYLDTCAAHPMTCLCAIDTMRHSHHHSWIREETYRFAEMVCGRREIIPRPEAALSGRTVHVTAPGATGLKLYWLDEKMTYSMHTSRFDGERLCQDQPWHWMEIQNETELPHEAAAWYVEATYETMGEPAYILTTAYIED